MDKIEKGINLATQEFKENLVELVNTCNLPANLIKYILIDILNQIKTLEVNAIQIERENYQKALKEAEKENKKKGGK